jgi:hypothetical protein
MEAVAYINKHGDLSVKYIKHREVISGSIAQLLSGRANSIAGSSATTVSRPPTPTDPIEVQDLMKANMFAEKLDYIAKVVALYISGGGLGCKPTLKHWPKWNGHHLEDAGGKKVDWITVGRFGGDLARGGDSEGE